MIEMPDFQKMYDYETNYHLTMDVDRMGKFIAHYELFKMVQNVPGALVECGVFKGTSFSRFAIFRETFGNSSSSKLIAFDVFSDEYPDTAYKEDQNQRDSWIATAGASSISTSQLDETFKKRNITNFELIAGDVLKTIPAYAEKHPELRISLLNIDLDFVEPVQCVLEHFYDRMAPKGIIIIDNYGAAHGDTKAIEDFIKGKNIPLQRFPFATRPCYIIKE